MFLHKYVVDGKTLYLMADKATKPSGTFSIKQEDWRGRALGRYNTVIQQMDNLTFTKKETEVAEPEEEKAPGKKSSVSEVIRKFVSSISE